MTENEEVMILENLRPGCGEKLSFSEGEICETIDTAISALKEIQQYREIGTVEECREAVEKQKAKKCIIDSCPDHTHYKCPSCGKIHLSRYKHGFPSLGRIPRFCDHCGQAIDENLEGMEDENT